MGKNRGLRRKGLLKQPLPRIPRESIPVSELPNWESERAALVTEKMFLLLDSYEIDRNIENPWIHLALKLAHEHEPGFQEQKVAGRPRKWTQLSLSLLVVEINALKEKGLSTNSAAAHLAKKEPWKSFLDIREGDNISSDPAEALRTRYERNKNKKLTYRNVFELAHSRIGSDTDKWSDHAKHLLAIVNKVDED